MKNSQKGFIIPVLLAIIAVLVIGGGAYVYKNEKSEVPAQETNNPITSVDNENSEENDKLIIILLKISTLTRQIESEDKQGKVTNLELIKQIKSLVKEAAKDEESVNIIITLLNQSTNENVRYGAAITIGFFPTEKNITALINAQKTESSPAVKKAIEMSLATWKIN